MITDDYAHEIKQDGSLIIHTVEGKHEGTYHFVANNSAGTVDQKVTLIVVEVFEKGVLPADEVNKLKGVNVGPKILESLLLKVMLILINYSKFNMK